MRNSQETVAATHSDLPDECWECIFKFIAKDDLNSLSLVSKQFFSIIDRLRFSIFVKNGTLPFLGRLLERFTNLKSLSLSSLNDNHDLNNLLCTISCFPLTKLTSGVGSFPFPSNGLRVFSQKITTLTSFNCSHCFLRNSDLSLIAECFPLLEKLNISNPLMLMFCYPPVTNTPTNFMDGMYSLLSKCRCIQHLNLKYARFLNDQHVAELSLFLAGLKSINLSSCNHLTESALFSLVRSCPLLSDIKMERTNIGKESAVSSNSLRDFVVVNPQLKSLCLARCEHLKDENIILFASIFPTLELLDLRFSDQISEGICQVLRRCYKITHLYLSGCSRVKLHGINFLVPKLEVLYLSNTEVDDETLRVISKNCCGLLQLKLENCDHLTEEGAKHVVENCTQLREMYLRGCHLSDEIRELFSRRGCLLYMYI
ncbi:putative F-box domain, leucine-rich repeat domain, L domain-containing protein [Medicago truncatula]|uniref:F-box/LRR protein n=1 Tax=Medicago truncatula TaxID=3880 RepID=A0A072U7E7_MEDTR|nr:F-box/LRR protein [Medicago truncatula]RHN50374.1 putative F-box domain, leucine-rich repeat domain, L domain-containing protein [Medicago truncatula]